MKTTFTAFKTLALSFTILIGINNSYGQNIEKQPVAYSPNPLAINNNATSDTLDLSITGNTVIAPNFKTPYNQLECFHFGSFVECNTDSIMDKVLNLDIIKDSNGELVFHDSVVHSGFCNDNLFLPECYTPSSWSPLSYTGYYSLETELNESNQENNFDTINFEVSNYVFAKENGGTQTIIPDQSSWAPEEPHSWAFGNYFYIVDNFLMQFHSATFAIGNADEEQIAGRLISIYIYKWDDLNEDSNMDSDERTIVGYGIYEIQGTELETDLITTPLLSFPSGSQCPQVPESNQAYVLMIEYATADEVDLELVASTDLNYGPMIFQSEQNGKPRYAGFLGVNGDLSSEPYSSIGFGRNVVPVLRLNLDMTDNIPETLPPSYNLLLSPNPTNLFLNIEVDFPKVQNDAIIKIFDVNGSLLTQQSYKNIKYENIKFDLSKFAAGTYFLQFVSDAGVRTERFVVQHF